MSERTDWRDKAYSRWHRPESLRRFIPEPTARALGLIDLDWCEYCRTCNSPIALFEVTKDWSQPKTYTVTRTLALMAGIQCFVVYYTTDDRGDVVEFAINRPNGEILTPADFANWLVELRSSHHCGRWPVPSSARSTHPSAGSAGS